MSHKDDGRPAFPRAAEGELLMTDEPGMTLRQWYAGQALVGVIVATQSTAIMSPQNVALECAMYADALIAELDKGVK